MNYLIPKEETADLEVPGKHDMVNKKEIPIWEKVTLTVEEASEYSNIGVNKIRELLNDPRCLFSLHVGRKLLVKRKEFEKFLLNSLEI